MGMDVDGEADDEVSSPLRGTATPPDYGLLQSVMRTRQHKQCIAARSERARRRRACESGLQQQGAGGSTHAHAETLAREETLSVTQQYLDKPASSGLKAHVMQLHIGSVHVQESQLRQQAREANAKLWPLNGLVNEDQRKDVCAIRGKCGIAFIAAAFANATPEGSGDADAPRGAAAVAHEAAVGLPPLTQDEDLHDFVRREREKAYWCQLAIPRQLGACHDALCTAKRAGSRCARRIFGLLGTRA